MEFSLGAVLPQIFTGLVLGMIFVLLAIGLSLIFGLMTVVNFAHGALYMLGAYCTVFLLGFTRNFWVALVVAPLMVGTFGLLVERFLIRRLYGRGRIRRWRRVGRRVAHVSEIYSRDERAYVLLALETSELNASIKG